MIRNAKAIVRKIQHDLNMVLNNSVLSPVTDIIELSGEYLNECIDNDMIDDFDIELISEEPVKIIISFIIPANDSFIPLRFKIPIELELYP